MKKQTDPIISPTTGGVNSELGIRDTRLIERAIRLRWPIPDKYREALINRQIAIAMNPESSPREATSAFKALLSADAQNHEQPTNQTNIQVNVQDFYD